VTSLVYDVAVIGGGPDGSAVSTHLARGGLHVGLFEREVFPRFKRAVLTVPSGGAFLRMPLRVALSLLFGRARLSTWARRCTGRPESRPEW
jgi:flavin-dependent dehydrogenase